MAPPSGLQISSNASDYNTRPDPSHLAPEDAFLATTPPRRLKGFDSSGNRDLLSRHLYRKDGAVSRSRSRRRKRPWKKLLWVKQFYPDNYTDQATFLENLQRNPRLKPYDFWPLVADSTVIVQHVCTVIIFVVCFVGIHQQRVSPVAVVGWGSIATSVGWFLWDWWVGKERDETLTVPQPVPGTVSSSASTVPSAESSTTNLLSPPAQPHFANTNRSSTNLLSVKPYSTSASSLISATSQTSAPGTTTNRTPSRRTSSPTDPAIVPLKHRPSSPLRGGRAHLRMNTIKSAILIYFTLLGLSPILKSLTRSTSSDSIWAMSFWLLAINIFFFDYSGTWVGVNKFPVASLSTNAALMASTVLASRLPSTGQVFSLTLFSIEVFGLFPVFRRYARHRSWRYHVILTVLLVLGAGGGVGMVLGAAECESPAACESQPWPWKSGLLGMVVGCLISALAMGGCSWWLIGLQKYKNEIYGPWDPARPIIISRRHWDDD
ncbi:Phosphatidylinositol N-acetylglucosaminyltransferase GPI2 subunit [Cytospora mali]|uniref:Phosphatidylinositol N-acetylglucosaminyltransferase GPI2 subunit n=1 Tax=Cytospora mali TaxID=578113 RepID=A0A194W9F6_CYTMA|nr:Phosphatidylinositol N-acetylglucosaminyltransferase GPI2 subunit [Valsa mali]